MPARRAIRHPTPLTRNHRQAFCANPLILLMLPEKQGGRLATQKGGNRQQVHTAGAARFGKLNHITFFITHEITRCQYSSHGLPDCCCLRSCQSFPAILPTKFTRSYLQGSIISADNITPFGQHRNRKIKLIPALSFWCSLCTGQRPPSQ